MSRLSCLEPLRFPHRRRPPRRRTAEPETAAALPGPRHVPKGVQFSGVALTANLFLAQGCRITGMALETDLDANLFRRVSLRRRFNSSRFDPSAAQSQEAESPGA
jgi:hypothetical protein